MFGIPAAGAWRQRDTVLQTVDRVFDETVWLPVIFKKA